MSINDSVSNPLHYEGKDGIQCKDALKARLAKSDIDPMQAYWVGCAFKYLWRFEDKNGAEDVRKAIQCLEFLVAELEGEDV